MIDAALCKPSQTQDQESSCHLHSDMGHGNRGSIEENSRGVLVLLSFSGGPLPRADAGTYGRARGTWD